MDAAVHFDFGRFEQLQLARDVVRHEGRTLVKLADSLSVNLCEAADRIFTCSGSLVLTGMGKAGLIAQKLSATFASTGTPSHFLHPAEAMHGDLGRIRSTDVVMALSFSGETEELLRILPSVRSAGASLLAVTSSDENTLGRSADVVVPLGPIREACPYGLAPTATTTAMLALGDALAIVVAKMRHFAPSDFARFHPGGSLGRQLALVDDVMRPNSECRFARDSQTIREVLVASSRPGRRTGAVMLVDDDEKLSGIFTDSDLARFLAADADSNLDRPIRQVMTRMPQTVLSGSLMRHAMEIFAQRKISELPVIDTESHPVGLIDITDLVGWSPSESPLSTASNHEPRVIPLPPRTVRQSHR